MASNIFSAIPNPENQSSMSRNIDVLTKPYASPNSSQIIQFPIGLGGAPGGDRSTATFPFTIFSPYKRGAFTFYSLRSGKDANKLYTKMPPPLFNIVLPTPVSALKTTYGIEYAPVNLGQGLGGGIQGAKDASAIERAASAAILGTGGAITKALTEFVAHPITAIESEGASVAAAAARGALINAVFGSALGAGPIVYGARGAVGGAIKALGGGEDIVDLITGVSDNPYTERVFKTVSFRSHVFSYVFMPKEYSESEQIDNIIQLFKFAMHPKPTEFVNADGFFEFPYEFQITHSMQDTTFMLLPSVLSSLSVDYSGETDTPKFFVPQEKSGKQYPARINLSMTFLEMVLLSRDRIDVPNAQLEIVGEKDTANTATWRFRF